MLQKVWSLCGAWCYKPKMHPGGPLCCIKKLTSSARCLQRFLYLTPVLALPKLTTM